MGARYLLKNNKPNLYQRWKYRVKVPITGTGCNGFQYKLTILYRTGMQSDFKDIRFTTMGRTRKACPYYIETYTASTSATVWVKSETTGITNFYLYYGNANVVSESSGADTFNQFNQFAGTGIDNTVDNNGNERHCWFDKAQNNLTGAYTLTGTPTHAAGAYTLDSGEAMVRALASTDTTGKWEAVVSFETAWVAAQDINLYPGSNTYLHIQRADVGDEIWIGLTVNGVMLIADTDTGVALGDSTYARATVTYDGTDWQMYWADVAVGAATAGDAPTTPKIGLEVAGSQVKCIELDYLPNVAHTDPFTADTETRYMQLSSTDLTTWAASAAGDVVVDTGNTKITLSSADDRGVVAVGKSYAYGSGEFEFAFDVVNDDGGGAERTGAVFCYQDINNHYKIVLEDDTAGAENLKFYKVVAGSATQLGTTKDISATYTRKNKTHGKVQYSRETGQMWVYLRDDAGVYGTAPDIADGFSSAFSYGKFGYLATVTTAGAGNLNVDFYPMTIRANLLIGETGVPAYETEWYFRDGITANSAGRTTSYYGTQTFDTVNHKIVFTSAATTSLAVWGVPRSYIGNTYQFTLKNTDSTAESKLTYIWIESDGTQSGGTQQNGYEVWFRWHSSTTDPDKIRIYKRVVGSATSLLAATSCTLSDNTLYYVKIVHNVGGTISVYCDAVDGTTLIGTSSADTTYNNGLFGVSAYSATPTNINQELSNIIISSIRYYMKPMLRGNGQAGEYWNGSAAVNAAQYTTDACADNSAEFTSVGGADAWDTNQGTIAFTSANDGIKLTGVSPTTQVITAKVSTTHTSNYPAITLLDDGNDGGSFASLTAGTKYAVIVTSTTNLRLSKVVAGSATTLKDCTLPTIAANTVYDLQVVYLASIGAFSFYWNGMLVGTITDTSITTANPTGFGIAGFNSGSVKYYYLSMVYPESGATSGVTRTHGSVSHGNLWSTGITSGYLMREYAATDPTTDCTDVVRINPPSQNIIWTDGNMTASIPFKSTYHPSVLGNLASTVTWEVGYRFNSIGAKVQFTNVNDMIKSGRVSRDFINKMFSAQFDFSGKDTGYNIYSGLYYKHVQFLIPDYSGGSNCVFVGFFPGSTTTFSPGNDSQTITAYDYGYYLSNQVLDFSDLVLLTPTDQALETKHLLQFDNGTTRINIGDRLYGATSGDSGTVIQVYGYTVGWVIMKACATGTAPYFTDDEFLTKTPGGTTVAWADGTTTDVTGTVSILYPENWVYNVLGGASWASKTGIEPYRLASTAAIWDITIPSCTFIFEETQSKISAIEEVCKKLNFIFYVKWRLDATTGLYIPCAYFIDESNIDDVAVGLDLPATVTITKPDAYLTKPVILDQKGDERVNQVIVKCQGFDGTWYTSTVESSGVTSGDEIPITRKEINPNITTQAEADTRAQDLYNYYSYQVATWKATFALRSDFALLQKLTFSGYGTDIPDGDYRIVGIEYHYAAQDRSIINEVTVTLVNTSQFASYLNLSRVFTGSVWEIQKIVKAELAKQAMTDLGTVTDVTAGEVTALNERGITTISRDAS